MLRRRFGYVEVEMVDSRRGEIWDVWWVLLLKRARIIDEVVENMKKKPIFVDVMRAHSAPARCTETYNVTK